MPLTLNCPKCHKPFRVRDESIGGRVRCPSCGAVLTVPASLAPASHFGFEMPPQTGNEGEVTGAHRPIAEDITAADFGRAPDVGTGPSALPAPPSIKIGSVHAAMGSNPPTADRPVTSTKSSFSVAPPPAAPGGKWSAPAAAPSSIPSAPPRSNIPSAPSPSMPTIGLPNQPPVGPAPATMPGPARKPSFAAVTGTDAAGWLAVQSGLGWIRFGLILCAIPLLGLVGHLVWVILDYASAMKEGPGFLGKAEWPRWKEIMAAYVAIPLVLAGPCILLGRLSCLRAPAVSQARSFMVWGLLFTLLGLAGVGYLVAELFVSLNLPPQSQTIALCAWIGAGFLADVMTLLFVGQIGWPLQRPQLLKGVGSVVVLAVVIPVGMIIADKFYPLFQPIVSAVKERKELFGGEDDKFLQTFMIAFGAAVGGALAIIFRYAAVVGSGKSAVRAYLQGGSPTA